MQATAGGLDTGAAFADERMTDGWCAEMFAEKTFIERRELCDTPHGCRR